VTEAQTLLRELGVAGDQVRTHTVDEPDPHLLALSADETVEALIFKMAVGLGFDCPRAYTIVSTRASRDPDFGLQVVGRIMRVDRRMQGLPDVPEPLRHGYVFLADGESQTGLISAAERINRIRAELAQVSDRVAVIALGDGASARPVTRGTISLLSPDEGPVGPNAVPETASSSTQLVVPFPELARPSAAGISPARIGRLVTAHMDPHIARTRGAAPTT
jgi:hypothetical protein